MVYNKQKRYKENSGKYISKRHIQLLSNILMNIHDLQIILVNKLKQIARSLRILDITSTKLVKSLNVTFQTIYRYI